MWKNTKHIFSRGWVITLLVLGAVSVIADVAAATFLKGFAGTSLGWCLNVLIAALPPFLLRSVIGKPVSWWIAAGWMILAFFLRVAVLTAAGHTDMRANLTVVAALATGWAFLRTPNITVHVSKRPILPGASPAYLSAIDERNREINKAAAQNSP